MSSEQTILIVDDTNTNIEVLLKLLSDYDLLVATNGKSALESARDEKIDLILLDIMMPEMDGYEVCRKLKSDDLTKDIPVVFITAKTDEESIEKAFDIGAVDYVAKPFKPKELIARVKTQLKVNRLIHKLEDRNKEVSHILDTTMEAVFILEGEKCIDVNDEALKLFECKNKASVLNKNIKEFNNLNLFETKDDIPYETNAIKCTGKSFPALVRHKDLNIGNRNMGVFAVLDLTDLKEKEMMLRQKNKIKSMDEMITNIAHQWRQPLSVISTSASGMLLQKEFGNLNDDLVLELNRAIIQSCDYLSQTLDEFQELINSCDTKKDSFYLDKLINNISIIFTNLLEENNISLDINIQEGIEVFSYKRGLEQVILNILKNAKDVLHDKNLDKRLIFIKASKDDDTTISIYDNGGGIDEENIDKIFDPYFTTKHKAQGTGLGLYSSFNILKNIGGTLGVENINYLHNEKEYKGAKFTITL